MALICDTCLKEDIYQKWPGPMHNHPEKWFCHHCAAWNYGVPAREQIRIEAARAYAYPDGMPDILRRTRRSLSWR